MISALLFLSLPLASPVLAADTTTDHDQDHVPTAFETPDGDNDPTNDDTDLDGTPDYLDLDDDGDGLWTWPDEDVDGDGDPTNDDTDGDNVPDYLDDTDGGEPVDEFLRLCVCDADGGGDGEQPHDFFNDEYFESGAACATGPTPTGALALLITLLAVPLRRRR